MKSVAGITRGCEACKTPFPAYRVEGAKVSRTTACPACGEELKPSAVQIRKVWRCYRILRRIAGIASEKSGIERAYAEDYAHEDALRAACRYSHLSRPRAQFTTYVTACVRTNVARWCHDDHAGGVSLRVKPLIEPAESENGPPRAELTDESDIPSRIATAEQLNRVRAALTSPEYERLTAYAEGAEGPESPGIAELLVKAQRAVQLPARTG